VALARVRESDRNCDEVRWVRGEIGEYLLVARRTGRDWRLAALTAKTRAWTVSLPFLAAGVRYRAAWVHDPQPDRPCFLPLPDAMDAASRPLIQLADSGGFTLDLVPLDPPKEA
jgi:alpha-glucosidase